MDEIHKDVSTKINTRRQKANAKQNSATNIINPSFSIGDFVLLRRATDRDHKLSFKWKGPRRTVAVHSPLVYSVERLTGGSIENVHSVGLLYIV